MATSPINFYALGARLQPLGLNEIKRSPLLLILDLHGVLVQRVQSSNRAEMRESQNYRPHWRRVNNHLVWKRPHLEKFLSIATARHTVAVWSAAERRNVMPVLKALSSDCNMQPSFEDRLAFISDRSICRPDKRSGPYNVIKYLPDVWGKLNFAYSEFDTIIVDDSPTKVRHTNHSAVVLPEYTPRNYGAGFNDEDTLLWLLLYLEYLIIGAGLDTDSLVRPPTFVQSQSLKGIASCRESLYSFEAFCSIGVDEACRASDSPRGFADVFYPPGALPSSRNIELPTPSLITTSLQPRAVTK